MTEQEQNAAMLAAENDQWDIANKILGGFGIEHISCAGRELKYINLGDTYSRTICKENDRSFWDSWGDWYESAEQEHCESEGLIRCGFCSEYTPQDKENWHEVVCQHCNNLVGG